MQQRHHLTALILLLIVIVAFVVAMPIAAGAATGPVTIDVATIAGGPDANNSANVATDSQWYYSAADSELVLVTPNGNYTLTGRPFNLDLYIRVSATANDSNITLNGLTTPGGSFIIEADCTANLVGTNALRSTHVEIGSSAIVVRNGSSFVLNGTGKLYVLNQFAQGFVVPLIVEESSQISILGSAYLSVQSYYRNCPSFITASPVIMGDYARLDIYEEGLSGIEYGTYVFQAADPETAYQWSVYGDIPWVITGQLTDPVITATQFSFLGIVTRIPREPQAPTITSPEHYTVKTCEGGSLPLTATGDATVMFTLDGAPEGVSIVNGVLVVAKDIPVDEYHFTITASNGVEPDYVQEFTLSVTPCNDTDLVAPIITSPNHLTVKTCKGGSLPLNATGDETIIFTLNGAPTGVSIVNGVLVVAKGVPVGQYFFTITASNGVEPDDVQDFTLTVTPCNDTDGNGGDNGGNNNLPATGDTYTLVIPILLALGIFVTLSQSVRRNRCD